jgi:hypothetical protein
VAGCSQNRDSRSITKNRHRNCFAFGDERKCHHREIISQGWFPAPPKASPPAWLRRPAGRGD